MNTTTPTRHCATCNSPMIPKRTWNKATPTQRHQYRNNGYTSAAGRNCTACANRARRARPQRTNRANRDNTNHLPTRTTQTTQAANAAIERATHLACLVRDYGPDAIGHYLDNLDQAQLYALTVTLAAMVPTDQSTHDLLAWTNTHTQKEGTAA